MVFLQNVLMCMKKVKLINHDCLPISMLLYVMLYIMLADLMLFAALSNADDSDGAQLLFVFIMLSFFATDLCKCFLFSCFVLVYWRIVCLLQV